MHVFFHTHRCAQDLMYISSHVYPSYHPAMQKDWTLMQCPDLTSAGGCNVLMQPDELCCLISDIGLMSSAAIGVPPNFVFNMPANPWLGIYCPPKEVAWHDLMDYPCVRLQRLHVGEMVPNDSIRAYVRTFVSNEHHLCSPPKCHPFRHKRSVA